VGDLVLLPATPVTCDLFPSQVVTRIYGRTGHTLIARDGWHIVNISATVKQTESPNIEAVQCVQEEPGVVEVRVVRGPGYTQEDEQSLLGHFLERMAEMDFSVV